MHHYFEDFQELIIEAATVVDAWDLPEEQFAQAVNDQAKLMAGLDLDIPGSELAFQSFTTLHF